MSQSARQKAWFAKRDSGEEWVPDGQLRTLGGGLAWQNNWVCPWCGEGYLLSEDFARHRSVCPADPYSGHYGKGGR